MRPIDADALLEKFTKLEAIALKYVGTLNERQDPNERDEWLMWTGILNERTAYKYEIVDAPTLDVAPVRHGKWIYGEDCVAMCDGYRCSNCGYFVPWDYQHKFISYIEEYKYCPECGARMDAERKEDA